MDVRFSAIRMPIPYATTRQADRLTMAIQFFPDLAFGWAFLAVLGTFLATATYMDLRFAIIPKWVSVTALPIGLLFNAIRCGWFAHVDPAAVNHSAFLIQANGSIGLGVLDGLLFALAGFLFGFVFYTVLWILGVAGGGDVKLCAAIGAWVGAAWTLWIIIASIAIVMVLVLAWGAYAISQGSLRGLRKPTNISTKKRARRLLTFSTPLCIATLLVLSWKLREELNLVEKPPAAVAARSQ
jgi:prepilin signal peptidase PulO-like enzyme (type II secretory pathway)